MLAGEPFSDRPQSVCPVLGAYLRSYNDVIDDDRRQDLFRYAAEAIGTAGPAELRRRRAERCLAEIARLHDQRSRVRRWLSGRPELSLPGSSIELERVGMHLARALQRSGAGRARARARPRRRAHRHDAGAPPPVAQPAPRPRAARRRDPSERRPRPSCPRRRALRARRRGAAARAPRRPTRRRRRRCGCGCARGRAGGRRPRARRCCGAPSGCPSRARSPRGARAPSRAARPARRGSRRSAWRRMAT